MKTKKCHHVGDGLDTTMCEVGNHKPQHTPTRCAECKWVHEADSVKKTSFMGVQFCPLHDRAVNCHEELVQALRDCIEGFRDTHERMGGTAYQKAGLAQSRAMEAISKMEGK